MLKKVKFDPKFVKQELMSITIRENMAVYEELKEKGEVVDAKSLNRLSKRIDKAMNASISDADKQVRRYDVARYKLSKLKRHQKKRRGKMLEWLKNYVKKIEEKEEKLFLDKYGDDINVMGLFELPETGFTEEEVLFAGLSEDIDEQAHTNEQTVIEEQLEDDNEQENAIEEDVSDIALVAPEGQEEPKEEKEETGKEKIQAYLSEKA